MILLAYTQDESEVVQLDTKDRESVQLNYSYTNAGDVLTRNSPFSQTFKLPTSERNNKFFEHFYDANLSAATFDSSKKTRCHILDEGVLVMAGYLQLRSVSVQNGIYSVAVYSDAANLFQESESEDLRSIFVTDGSVSTDYDYSQTAANVISSFNTSNDITSGTVGAGTIVIPLFDHGRKGATQKMHVSDSTNALDNLYVEDRVFPSRFKPAMKVLEIWNLIFKKHGYTYTSDFLSSARFARLYMQLGTNTPELDARPFFGFRAGLSADQTISSDGAHTIELDTDTGSDFYDPDGLWSTSLFTFTAPQNMTARFGGNIYVTRPNSGVTANVAIRIYSSTDQYVTPYSSFVTNEIVFWWNPAIATFDLQAGETVSVEVLVQDLTGGNISVAQTSSFGDTNFRLIEYDNNGGDIQIHVPSQMPDMTEAEFLKEIVNRFNLVLESSPDNERHLNIEPHADWLDSGSEIDWTGKLDLSKEITLSPTNELRKKTIIYTDAEGKDESNTFRQDANGYVYGRYREIVEDDFAQGEQKWESKFKPVHVHAVTTGTGEDTIVPNFVTAHLYKISEDGEYEPIADHPFLFYHNGMKDVGETLYIESESFTQYPLCSGFDTSPNSSTTQSIYWEYQYPSGYGTPPIGEEYVNQNLVRAYWSRFLNQIYHPDARILQARFYLKPTDILNLRFNDLINVRGTHYRLLEIKGYTVNSDGTTQCKLIKDQGTGQYVARCGYIPDVWALDGTIRFVDPDTGSTTYTPGEACCEEVGGIYDPTSTKCFWRTPRTGGQGLTTGLDRRQTRMPIIENSDVRTYDFGQENAGVYRSSLYALVNENRTNEATSDGESGGDIQIPLNTLVQGRILVNTVQTTYDGSSGAIGSADFIEYSFTASNVDGTTSVTLQEIADARITDSSATGNRSVAASISGTRLVLTCTGETYARCAFFMEVIATYQDLTFATTSADTMLTEAGDDLVFQNADHVIPG